MRLFRVWMLAKEAGVPSMEMIALLRTVGVKNIADPKRGLRSASSPVALFPCEHRALIRTAENLTNDDLSIPARNRAAKKQLGY